MGQEAGNAASVLALPQCGPKRAIVGWSMYVDGVITYHCSPWRPKRTNPRDVATRAFLRITRAPIAGLDTPYEASSVDE